MVIAIVFVIVSGIGAVVAGDLAIESAQSGLTQLTLFGNDVHTATGHSGVYIVVGLVAVFAAALATSLATLRGRSLERRMAAQLDGRWQQISERNAGFEARNELLTWRARELENQIEDLESQRTELIEEMDHNRIRTRKLRDQARLMKQAIASAGEGATVQDLVLVPDADEDSDVDGMVDATEPATVTATETNETEAGI